MEISRARRMTVTAIAVLVAVAGACLYRFADSRGFLRSVTPVANGACQRVAGLAYAAAIAADSADGFVLFARNDGHAEAAGHPSAEDGIYMLKAKAPPVKLAGGPRDFHPRAISLLRGADGALGLAVLSRRSNGLAAIAVFALKPERQGFRLVEVSDVESAQLAGAGDIAAAAGTQIYVADTYGSRSALGRWLDDVFLLPRAGLSYFDGRGLRQVVKHMNTPTGVAVSGDGLHLYATQFYPHNLVAFTRNPFSGLLTIDKTVSLPASPGKIAFAPDGSLLIATSPRPDARGRAPSEILKVRLAKDVPAAIATLFADDGGVVSGAQSVGQLGNRLFIGSAYDARVAECRLP